MLKCWSESRMGTDLHGKELPLVMVIKIHLHWAKLEDFGEKKKKITLSMYSAESSFWQVSRSILVSVVLAQGDARNAGIEPGKS